MGQGALPWASTGRGHFSPTACLGPFGWSEAEGSNQAAGWSASWEAGCHGHAPPKQSSLRMGVSLPARGQPLERQQLSSSKLAQGHQSQPCGSGRPAVSPGRLSGPVW